MMEHPINDLLISIAYGNDCRERVSPKLTKLYESAASATWGFLTDAFGSPDSTRPLVEIVHSPIARPTTFLGQGWRTLVYDQYLGQVFNKLTRLVLSDAPPTSVDQYFHKLYAQRAFVTGRWRTAALFGLLAKAHASDASPPSEDPAETNLRAQLVTAEEVFIIAHELVHVLLAENPDRGKERTEWYANLMREVHSLPLSHVDFPDLNGVRSFAERMAQDRDEGLERALARRGIKGNAVQPPGNLERDIAFIEARGKMQDIIIENKLLLEECICDAFAYLATLTALSAHRHDPLTVTSAVVFALHNLRVMQLLDRLVSGQRDAVSLEDFSDPFAQSAARLSMLRSFIMATMVISGNTEMAERAHQHAIRVNEDHAKIVLDQVMFCMPFDAWESRLEAMQEVVLSAEDYERDPAALRELLMPGAIPESA